GGGRVGGASGAGLRSGGEGGGIRHGHGVRRPGRVPRRQQPRPARPAGGRPEGGRRRAGGRQRGAAGGADDRAAPGAGTLVRVHQEGGPPADGAGAGAGGGAGRPRNGAATVRERPGRSLTAAARGESAARRLRPAFDGAATPFPFRAGPAAKRKRVSPDTRRLTRPVSARSMT